MYSETDVSSFKNIFSACFIRSKEVDFQMNSIVNLLSMSDGGFFAFLSSKQISSVAVILTMCPRDFH
jgi:hypothetical protein